MTTGATVLIVDDSMTVRAMVRGHLEEQGYQVREVDNGTAAIEQCLADPPDVVLLDIEMPGLNGHEVLARLKADESVKDIPVVFLTDHSSMDEVLRGLEGGANDYLRKSAVEELVARVGAAARVKKLQDELRLLNLQLDKTSRTDVLTGLFNRRHLEEQLRKSISTGRRREEPVGLLLFDLDHFKSVNDTYGHLAGDAVLVEFSRRVETELRAGDIAGRWGGEEFLVILPHTGLAGTVEAGERIRAAIAAEPFFVADQPIAVTVSGGGAAGVGMGDEDLVHRADNGLYEAKDRGRNCVVVTAETGPPIVTGNWVD
jgi:two-component system cell cycle response regulator